MLGVWQLMSGSVAVLALSAAQLGQGLAAELTASRALEAAIEVLLGEAQNQKAGTSRSRRP
jgi:hypothetical protein